MQKELNDCCVYIKLLSIFEQGRYLVSGLNEPSRIASMICSQSFWVKMC